MVFAYLTEQFAMACAAVYLLALVGASAPHNAFVPESKFEHNVGDSLVVGIPPLYKDSSAPIDQRVADLVARMTLDEKVEQLIGP